MRKAAQGYEQSRKSCGAIKTVTSEDTQHVYSQSEVNQHSIQSSSRKVQHEKQQNSDYKGKITSTKANQMSKLPTTL